VVGARGIAIVALGLLAAAPARGAHLGALEGAVRDAFSERTRLVEERERRMGEAAVLADEIARRKGGTHPPRADRGLEEALKRFDRVAAHLDQIDRRIATQDHTIATLRRKFEEAANAAAVQLGGKTYAGPIGELAREMDAIDQARDRVAKLGAAEAAFRPVLEVKGSPNDGAVELGQKVLLLEAEKDRVLKGLGQLDADARVLAARILAKQRLSAELENAARTAGSGLEVLRRESENVAQALHDLGAQRDRAVQQKADLSAAMVQIDRRLDEIRASLRQPGAPKGDIR
jgi:hypothetical protein